MPEKEKNIQCSFCLKEQNEVAIIVSGADANICNECVNGARSIMIEQVGEWVFESEDPEGAEKKKSVFEFTKTPREIKAYLDEYIIGQDQAKKVLSVAIYNHYKRLQQEIKEDDVEIEKSNIIMVGETGTGKTLLARTISKLLKVPFAMVDATVFTEAGYVGEDIESILSRLLQSADYDVGMAEKGIVYIDEIDKIGRKSNNPSITRDVSGEGVQQGLLKLLEGSEVLVPPQGGRKHPDQQMIKIDTKNILFICGGAFEGIDKVIARRVRSNTIGFKTKVDADVSEESLLEYVNTQDLKSFGLIPELLGRLPVVTYLLPLDKSALRSILTSPKNALIKQYKKLFQYENIKLKIDEEVLDYLVDKALEFKIGGRGLRSICELVMTDAMFELPDNKTGKTFHLTLKYAKEKIEKAALAYSKVA